jgi:hypothetical protein
MRFGKYMGAAAAAALDASPVMAAPANPAASLSVSKSVRAGSTKGKDELAGGGVFVAVIAAVAVIIGIIIVAQEDDSPDSP